MGAARYRAWAWQTIPRCLEDHAACTAIELIARLSDERYPGAEGRIDPHIVSPALSQMEALGMVETDEQVTRGGRSPRLYRLASIPRTKAVERRLARKRLLAARYLGWATGSSGVPGVLGPAAERVARTSLIAAAPKGLLLLNDGGPVTSPLGVDLSHEPLDAAAWRTPLVDGLPGPPALLPIEVKNVRDWLYPHSHEPYQLLDKAARITASDDYVQVVPVLITRRAHFTLFRMAKMLGFYVVQTRRQYLPATLPEDKVTELRAEMGMLDLTQTSGPDDAIVRAMTSRLDNYRRDGSAGRRWRTIAPNLLGAFRTMRFESNGYRRSQLVHDIRAAAVDLLPDYGPPGW